MSRPGPPLATDVHPSQPVEEKLTDAVDRTGTGAKARWSWQTPVLAVLAIALLGSNAYFLARLNYLEERFGKAQAQSAEQISQLVKLAESGRNAQQEELEALTLQLEEARTAATKAVGQARAAAVRKAEELARQLQAEQRKQQEQLQGALTEVRQSSATANDEVGSVKSDVATTRSDLDQTVSEMKKIKGDLGFVSGMIATNAKELAALRRLGDREYAEIDLSKQRKWTRVGNVSLKLKKTDTKRYKYSIELLADDRVVEKKDRYINEPVQFYLSRSKQPYELVVNEVQKDRVVGYLAVPKVEVARK